jgi:sulfur transfer protein SufE/stress-induced morphogen
MIPRSSIFFASLVLLERTSAYVVLRPCASSRSLPLWSSRATSTDARSSDVDENNPMNLPSELLKIANAFEAIGDDKLRYKQLLYMANQLAPLDASKQIPENKVPGCLSTVYVDVKPAADQTDDDALKIDFEADSDGLLTKGLVALLIRGLSGNTAAEIAQVNPAFIQKAGISASLTPGRNSGFLNMLAVMKNKAQQLQDAYEQGSVDAGSNPVQEGDDSAASDRPMYNAMIAALQLLKPASLELVDNSDQHAGHMESPGSGESHFELDIVSEAFEGLNLVKRHKLVYMMLGEVMPKIHALQIRAKTPEEVSK